LTRGVGKAIAPFVDKMIKKYPDARFYNYDTDVSDDISQELGANQMPTFHAFKDGDLVGSVTGAKASKLEELIKEGYDGKVADD
jgi:thioredoxin 1